MSDMLKMKGDLPDVPKLQAVTGPKPPPNAAPPRFKELPRPARRALDRTTRDLGPLGISFAPAPGTVGVMIKIGPYCVGVIEISGQQLLNIASVFVTAASPVIEQIEAAQAAAAAVEAAAVDEPAKPKRKRKAAAR